MATFNYDYRSKKESSFLTAKLRFSFKKKGYVKTVKIPVKTSKLIWNSLNKKNVKDAELRNQIFSLQTKLGDLKNHVLECFDNEPSKANITENQWLEQCIKEFYNPTSDKPNTLSCYINYYMEIRKNEIKQHLSFKLKGLKKKLLEFEKQKRHTYKIIEINETFKADFIEFLNEKKYSHNYIRKQFTFIKQLCNHANYNGIEVSPQLKKIGLKAEKTPKIYLSLEEIEKIEKTEYNRENLTVAKDWLIVSVYTGQRISDFMNFKTDMIRIENGKHLIEFTQKKTNKHMTVPLHQKVLQVIERNDNNFPKKLVDSKYNKYLKEVCKAARIDEKIKGRKLVNIGTEKNKIFRNITDMYPKYELISSHVGRRSFATNFYGKIPTTYLIYVTGHSTEKMFLNYIGKSDKDLALEVADYF